MVLTTLAASFYSGEKTVAETLLKLVERISEYFSDKDNFKMVVNPINDGEVLSENWLYNIGARRSFVAFIIETQRLLLEASKVSNEQQLAVRMEDLFGNI